MCIYIYIYIYIYVYIYIYIEREREIERERDVYMLLRYRIVKYIQVYSSIPHRGLDLPRPDDLPFHHLLDDLDAALSALPIHRRRPPLITKNGIV